MDAAAVDQATRRGLVGDNHAVETIADAGNQGAIRGQLNGLLGVIGFKREVRHLVALVVQRLDVGHTQAVVQGQLTANLPAILRIPFPLRVRIFRQQRSAGLGVGTEITEQCVGEGPVRVTRIGRITAEVDVAVQRAERIFRLHGVFVVHTELEGVIAGQLGDAVGDVVDRVPVRIRHAGEVGHAVVVRDEVGYAAEGEVRNQSDRVGIGEQHRNRDARVLAVVHAVRCRRIARDAVYRVAELEVVDQRRVRDVHHVTQQ